MEGKIIVQNEKKDRLKMNKRENTLHVKVTQLKKRYRYATGGSGRRFLLGFALRQLRTRAKRTGTEKKSWTITTNIPSQEVEEEDVSESEESVENEEDFFDLDSVEDATRGQIPLSSDDPRTFAFDPQNQQFQDDRETTSLPPTHCLQLLTAQEFVIGLQLLAEIEHHVSISRVCHHPPLKDLIFSGSVNIDDTTPLLLACHYGKLECVVHIVENWGVDVNSAAIYYLDPFEKKEKIQGATPLFVAAFNRHLSIAQYLVGKGADLDLKTSVQNNDLRHEYSGLTPLQGVVQWPVQSRKTYQEISKDVNEMVLFLLESGADPSPLPPNGIPIWDNPMCGVYATIALIDHGVDLNQKNWNGTTILHYWASAEPNCFFDGKPNMNFLAIVMLLVDKGADVTARDKKGFTPVFDAINAGNWAVVNFLLEREEIDRMHKIDALEMAAATIFDEDSDDQQELERAFGYMRQALRLRKMEPNFNQKTPIILKSGRTAEWITTEQLENVIDPFEYKLQSFYTLLRIFSSLSWEAVSNSRLSFLDDLRRAQRYVDLLDIMWAILEVIHGFLSTELENLSLMTDHVLDNLIDLMSEREKVDPLLFSSVNWVKPLEVMVETDPFCSSQHYANTHMNTLLRFVDFLANRTELINKDIVKLLRQLVSQDSRDTHGRSILRTECANVPLRLPNIQLLLQAGADPNAGDVDGNGPLHAIATIYYGNVETVAGAARLLLHYGAHLDMVNKESETPAEVWIRQNGIENGALDALPEWLREPGTVPKLTCLSARIIRRENIEYDDLTLPAALHSFVEMH